MSLKGRDARQSRASDIPQHPYHDFAWNNIQANYDSRVTL